MAISEDQMSYLEPGDLIRIVDSWTGRLHNSGGCMDKYLGKTLTVSAIYRNNVHGRYCKVMEDNAEWNWFAEMIDEINPDESPEEYVPACDEEITWLLAPEGGRQDG